MALETFKSMLSVKVRDHRGDARTIAIPCEVAMNNPTELKTLIGIIVGLWDNVLDGKIESAELYLGFDVSGVVKASPIAGNRVRSGGTLSFRDTAGNANPIYFPTMKDSKFVSGGALNTDDISIVALLATITNDSTSGDARVTFTDEDDRQFDPANGGGFIRGFYTTRK